MGDNNGYLPFPKGFATTAIHTGQDPNQWDSLCVVPPIVMSTTFMQHNPGKPKKSEYGRAGNPTRDVLEECLAKLEGAKHGLCFASGVGAATTLLSVFKMGDHIICSDDVYGGINTLFSKIASPMGITTSFVDVTDLSNIEKAIKPNTKLMWMETPTNPIMKVLDIKAVAELVHKHNILLTVDNTFMTPYLQRPLQLGADLVVHSLTKYMNGHTDVIMGAILLNNKEVHDKLRFLQNAIGSVPSPFDCYLVNRSLKTLGVRMRQHSYNGLIIAKFLESHPKVTKVIHPGLPSHPQHALFKKQTSGHSGMISFYLNGNLQDSKKLLSALKVFTLAESLGGCDSLVELPSIMTHAEVPEEQRRILNITDNLVRLSVGLEDVDDLVEDLKQALNVV